jgi:hypothetical protein
MKFTILKMFLITLTILLGSFLPACDDDKAKNQDKCSLAPEVTDPEYVEK